MHMTSSSKFSGWTIADLNNAIASDERVLRKEGDRCRCVDRVALESMRNERVADI